jgi:hypothetical protein
MLHFLKLFLIRIINIEVLEILFSDEKVYAPVAYSCRFKELQLKIKEN